MLESYSPFFNKERKGIFFISIHTSCTKL